MLQPDAPGCQSKRPGTGALALLFARLGSPASDLTVAESVLGRGSGTTTNETAGACAPAARTGRVQSRSPETIAHDHPVPPNVDRTRPVGRSTWSSTLGALPAPRLVTRTA